MNSKDIIHLVAKAKAVKYVQAGELASFLICGYALGKNLLLPGILAFILGIFLALLAGEAAIEEFKLYGDKK